jgi:hypothetical protein
VPRAGIRTFGHRIGDRLAEQFEQLNGADRRVVGEERGAELGQRLIVHAARPGTHERPRLLGAGGT